MLSEEEMQTGKRVFKRGQALRHGLIDVRGVLDVIKEQQASITATGAAPGNSSDMAAYDGTQ